ncbi:hypothetical protein TEA_007151 [Camellia sinensis var. sinensis]|uniref:Uncharacterized protein n=1 Tax=Camellia sinensis var. sinensis TaxID=542762 RepID=A0A4S4DVP3_CAMSN|nr:hypothetical protein TEA_007151 [Camellia sinensis var. sinensis]
MAASMIVKDEDKVDLFFSLDENDKMEWVYLLLEACNLFICCSYVGLVKTGSCSLQSVYMLLLCWAALYCICGCSLMLLDWGRLEDAGYAIGARSSAKVVQFWECKDVGRSVFMEFHEVIYEVIMLATANFLLSHLFRELKEEKYAVCKAILPMLQAEEDER